MTAGRIPVTTCLAWADLLQWTASWLRPPAPTPPLTLDDAQRSALLAAVGVDHDASLASTLAALEQARAQTPLSSWMQEHHRLFDAAMACPANEASHVRRDKGAILGDICGFHRAFGFQAVSDQGDRPDHLACELEFVALLLVMLAGAQQRESDDAQVTRQALESFAVDHLDVWLDTFCHRLAASTTLPLYEHVATMLHEAWALVVQGMSLPRAEQPSGDMPQAEPDSPYECGLADAAQTVDVRVEGQPLSPQ